MNITIITGPFGCLPPYTMGAVEKLWFQLGNKFRELGHKVTFISKTPPVIEKQTDADIFIKGYGRTGSWTKDALLDSVYSWKALKVCPSNTDILVLNTLWTPIFLPLFRKKFKKSVFNVERFPKKQFGFYMNVDSFACASKAVMDELIRQTPKAEKKSTVVSNPIETDVFFEKNDLPHEQSFCYAGRVHPEKGIDILVKAFAKVKEMYPDATLNIIGPRKTEDGGGGEEYINYLNTLCESINWIDPIRIPTELSDAIRKYRYFCYPSVADKGETFGVAPLEAMALGRPTIVSSLECFEDFIENNVNGLVFNHRIENADTLLYETMLSLIENDGLAEKLAKNGAETALKFSIDNIAEKYLGLFANLLNEK